MKESDVHAASELLAIADGIESVSKRVDGYVMLSVTEEPNGDGQQHEVICLTPAGTALFEEFLGVKVESHLAGLVAEIRAYARQILGCRVERDKDAEES